MWQWRAFNRRFPNWKSPRLNKSIERLCKIDEQTHNNSNEKIRTFNAEDVSHNIHFLGVWDTVSAIVPLPVIPTILNCISPFRFYTLKPGNEVGCARHALAIDDERKPFHPELWDENGKKSEDHIKQVWFAGSHSNVGGGYTKQGMSLVALDWMMTEAEKEGLVFFPESRRLVKNQMNVNDKLYDPRSGMGLYYRWDPRNVAEICENHGITKPLIHESVIERILSSTEGYNPGNIPFNFEIEPTEISKTSAAGTRFKEMIEKFKLQHDAEIAKVNSSDRSMLEGQFKYLVFGRLSYAMFIFSSLVFAVSALCKVPKLIAECTLCKSAAKYTLGQAILLIVIVGLLSWCLAYFVDKKMAKAYDGFWYPITKIVKAKMKIK